MPSDYDDICREDYAYDAYLERLSDDAVGYCKYCGERVYRHVDKGRRTASEGQTEPDVGDIECPKCGELNEDEVKEGD
jgi:Zn finger protein HypA/HybF involved in hydrogenase expression